MTPSLVPRITHCRSAWLAVLMSTCLAISGCIVVEGYEGDIGLDGDVDDGSFLPWDQEPCAEDVNVAPLFELDDPSTAPPAAEWNDLENWSSWTSLAFGGDWAAVLWDWGWNTCDRIPVRVVDVNGNPVVNARVTLSAEAAESVEWIAITDAHGNADLFKNFFTDFTFGSGYDLLRVDAYANGAHATFDEVYAGEDGRSIMTLDIVAPPTQKSLDLMFVVDTTASMANDLAEFQAVFRDMVGELASDPELNLRLSVNLFRDEGDDYVIESHDFTSDPSLAATHFETATAEGGGDAPDAIEAALNSALTDHLWRPSARSRVLILFTDTTPHPDPVRAAWLDDAIRLAALKGIRIIPIGGSQTPVDAEFVLRTLDISSGGTYVFYSDVDAPPSSCQQPVGNYVAEPLDHLLLRVIRETL